MLQTDRVAYLIKHTQPCLHSTLPSPDELMTVARYSSVHLFPCCVELGCCC